MLYHLSHQGSPMLVKSYSKFSKPGFSSMWSVNLQMFKLVLEKAEEPKIKLPKSAGSSKKQESSRKYLFLLYWLCQSLSLFEPPQTLESHEENIRWALTEGHSAKWIRFVAQMVENLPVMQETQVQSLGWEAPLEKGKATHFRILAWRIPWTEEPGRLQSLGSQRVGHNWTTNTHMQTSVFRYYLSKRRIQERGFM